MSNNKMFEVVTTENSKMAYATLDKIEQTLESLKQKDTPYSRFLAKRREVLESAIATFEGEFF